MILSLLSIFYGFTLFKITNTTYHTCMLNIIYKYLNNKTNYTFNHLFIYRFKLSGSQGSKNP